MTFDEKNRGWTAYAGLLVLPHQCPGPGSHDRALLLAIGGSTLMVHSDEKRDEKGDANTLAPGATADAGH